MPHRSLLLVSLAVLCGCATASGVARTRAANDFSCDEGQVSVTNVGGDSYRAEGCGQSAVYDCSASGSYQGTTTDYTCKPEH